MDGKDQIRVFDWQRLLIGKTPWAFLAEVAVRGLLIYVLLLVTIRLMGKRVAGQLSLSELAIMVTLGAAIGVPMEVADNGLLPGFVLLGVALLYQRGIGWLSWRNRRVELITQGDVETLVADGILTLKVMSRVGLSQERVFAAVRQLGISQLGQVKRIYIETSGSFSVFRAEVPRPGLPAVPPDHPGMFQVPDLQACGRCGTLSKESGEPCPTCRARAWQAAVVCEADRDRRRQAHPEGDDVDGARPDAGARPPSHADSPESAEHRTA